MGAMQPHARHKTIFCFLAWRGENTKVKVCKMTSVSRAALGTAVLDIWIVFGFEIREKLASPTGLQCPVQAHYRRRACSISQTHTRKRGMGCSCIGNKNFARPGNQSSVIFPCPAWNGSRSTTLICSPLSSAGVTKPGKCKQQHYPTASGKEMID